MPRIRWPLFWNENNERHLLQSHNVTREEVEEVLFDQDGDRATYRRLQDGDKVAVFGRTVGGRFLKLVGEFLENGQFRVFAARDMVSGEKRWFRKF